MRHRRVEDSDYMLENFKPEETEAYRYLTTRFGQTVSKEQIVTLGQIISHLTHIELTREWKRRKATILKWFDMNFDAIKPVLDKRLKIALRSGIEV